MARHNYETLSNRRDMYASRVMMVRMSLVADPPRVRHRQKNRSWKEILMFPLHQFGKARQDELLKLAEHSSSALEQETEWFARSDWKPAPSFDEAAETCKTASALASHEELKGGVFSRMLRMLGKVQQALRIKAHT